jgi:Alginate lyase
MKLYRQSIHRRSFCVGAASILGHMALAAPRLSTASGGYALVSVADHDRILRAAAQYVKEKPQTITAFPSDRSPGGLHDFFSQADYFWPNPTDPNGPYINRDGESNPANFVGHRKAMIALSVQMPALTAAWLLTHDPRYGSCAADHPRAWFVDPATRMNPNLEFSQGVKGVSTGRSWGIIDTLHLVEVARAAGTLQGSFLHPEEARAVKSWFRSYLDWMKTSQKGIAERNAANNHGTCWALQAAEFARLVQDEATREEVRANFRSIILPDQVAANGSFPKELARTKPYSYSIFNLDVMATLCQSLSASREDMFSFALRDGRGICRAMEFMYSFLEDKKRWSYAKDVEHFDALPVRSPGLIFCGLACHRPEDVKLWRRLNPDPTDPEIIRNYPIRQPLLWF